MISGTEATIFDRLSVFLPVTFGGLGNGGNNELFAKPSLIELP